VIRTVLVATALVCTLACQPAAQTTRPTISSAELAAQIKSGTAPLILDVRTPDEYRSGHIPGSVNIPIDQLPARLAEIRIAKADEVVVHCEVGGRAAKAEAILARAGYGQVVDLDGHMKAWRESGLPVE
jgi:phage shock protein E